MAEPHPRAGRPGKGRPASALLLAGAIVAIVLGGLFMARPASAAPAPSRRPLPRGRRAAASAATAEKTATTGQAGHLAANQLTALVTPAAPDAGICNVPGIGDIGGLLGLCQAGSGVVGDLNNICTPGAPAPSRPPRASTR